MDTFKKRLYSFMWRASAFNMIAILGYISNFQNVQAVDPNTLWAMFWTTNCAFVIGELTKWLNSEGTFDIPPIPNSNKTDTEDEEI